ncbi:hypothetical protein ASE35_08675 [Lysobacter sp. Root916]|nr:hypothetical protein ASE35_08675 [Lysobacter sp. Root916]
MRGQGLLTLLPMSEVAAGCGTRLVRRQQVLARSRERRPVAGYGDALSSPAIIPGAPSAGPRDQAAAKPASMA